MTPGVPLLVDRDGAVAILTINDAPYNRMSLAFMDELERAVAELTDDESIRAVVLTAAGDRSFSVGMNLKEIPQGIREKGGLDGLLDQRLRVLEAIENMNKPWIVTLFGYCLGGGLELPLACHFRFAATEGAQIGLPEMDIGGVPAWGGTARLARCIGRDQALDMILRARKISGPRALAIRLVHEVWPLAELKERAVALGHELSAMPREAVAGVLGCIVGSETKTLRESLVDERRAVHATSGTANSREGMNAFLEKRKPVFNRE